LKTGYSGHAEPAEARITTFLSPRGNELAHLSATGLKQRIVVFIVIVERAGLPSIPEVRASDRGSVGAVTGGVG
jgi:hypothetical protein